MLSLPLSIFKKYQNEPKLYGVCSSNILFKMKDETYIVNLAEFKSTRNSWIA